MASWNNRYLVLKVLEWDAGQKELEALAAYLQQPKYIHTQRGDFLLNRQYKWYEMKTPDCGFTLDTDEGSDETCEAALAAYKKHEMNKYSAASADRILKEGSSYEKEKGRY